MFTSGYRQNKFKNKKTVFGGRQYHSKLESSVAADLELARHAVEPRERVVDVVPQFPIDLYLNGNVITDVATPNVTVKICRYYMDFKVTYADGHVELIEAKGFATDLWRLKWKLTEGLYMTKYPDVELRIIK